MFQTQSRLTTVTRREMETRLYVGGLSYDTTEDQLRTYFAQAGTVTSVQVITDRDTGRSKGFGFVEMSSQAEMNKAIQLFNGKELDGRTLTVNQAKPREERGGGGGRGGDRRGDDRRGDRRRGW
jgi:RNA recognition motif-containing protein